MNEDLSAKAEASLARLKVTPQTGVFVTNIDERGVTVKPPNGVERKLKAGGGVDEFCR